MKIVHITTVHSPLDIRIYHKQCKSLANNGYEVSLIAPASTSIDTVDNVELISIAVESSRLKRMFQSTLIAFNKALYLNAKIYHFHDPELIPIGILLRLMGKKVIYDVHEDLPRQLISKEWINAWLRYPLSLLVELMEWISSRLFFSAIVTVTPTIAARFPSSKTVLIQNFPKLNELKANTEILWSERSDQVIYVGGIEPVRGAIECITAFELLKNSLCEFVLAGLFVSQELEDQCRTQKGWNNVVYKGWLSREDVRDMLGQVKAGLVLFYPIPNHLDAQPNKLFEYMSAGIPIIASDFPLWRKIVESTNCGLLVNPLKPKDIAKAIDWLLDHPKDAEEMGRNGRKAVEEKYNWTCEEKKLLDLYQRLSV